MTLTDNDYEILANQIDEGEGYATLTKDDEELEVHYQCEEDAYREDDYFNGTGAWVVTAINLRVLNVQCINADGDPTPTDFDEDRLYKELHEQRIY